MASEKVLALDSDSGLQDFDQGSITFVGTATVIIRWGGFTILTDPNFLHKGDHVHLGYGIHSTRLTNPAMELDEVQNVDFIVLSHLHEDHFDRLVEQKLDRSIPIISTPHAATKLTAKGFRRMIPLQTWESIRVTKGPAALRLTAMPGRHAPGILHHLRVLPPVMGSMIDFEHVGQPLRFRMYISGDTLIHDDIHEIPRRFADVDLALLHLGGTRVLGLLVTMDARQGVRMLEILRPRRAIPIHYNDYDAFKSPLEDFQREVERAGLTERVSYIYPGDIVPFTVGRPGCPARVARQPGPLAEQELDDVVPPAEPLPAKESTNEAVLAGAAGLWNLAG